MSPRFSASIDPPSQKWKPATAGSWAEELTSLAEIYDVSVAWLLGEAPDTLDVGDPRLELAARELTKLKPHDLDRLLRLLAAMRNDSTPNAEGGGQ